jgi:hypothetical protein
MLESRNIITTMLGEPLRVSTKRGCRQGGVLSPLLWSLVVNKLLWGLNDNIIVQQDMQMILQS